MEFVEVLLYLIIIQNILFKLTSVKEVILFYIHNLFLAILSSWTMMSNRQKIAGDFFLGFAHSGVHEGCLVTILPLLHRGH
jgi:hypothetical protein